MGLEEVEAEMEIFSLSCTLLLENGGTDVGGQQFSNCACPHSGRKVWMGEAVQRVRQNPLSVPLHSSPPNSAV